MKFAATLGMMLLTSSALLFIYAELVSRAVTQGLPQQERHFAEAIAQLGKGPISCRGNKGESANLTREETLDLLRRALAATLDVSYPFQNGILFSSFKIGLPYTAGLYSVYHASMAAQRYLVQLVDGHELCHGIPGSEEAQARKEEQSSQAQLDELLARLRELESGIAAARAAYQDERPRLTAIAWSLGILQSVGWGCLFVLPSELRARRQRRAQRRNQVA